MKRPRAITSILVTLLLFPSLVNTAALGAVPSGLNGMGTGAPGARILGVEAVGPSHVFRDSLYSTGGTGLRNQSKGGITINGNGASPPLATAAFLYWAVITTGPAVPTLHGVIDIQKIDPVTSKGAKLKGTVVGTGGSPCWPGDTLTVFRAPVPLPLVNAGGVHSGAFNVAINCAGASSCAGSDPWGAFFAAPLWEGASLVIIWPSTGATTSIFDTGISGTLFFGSPGITYSLALPVPTAGITLWDNVGADGQVGFSRASAAGIADEATTINGVAVAGPGSSYNDSDWNGNDSTPLPRLWDTTGHDISAVGPGTAILTVTVASPTGGGFDCLNLVVNVVGEI